MTLPSTGTISMAQVRSELSASGQLDLNNSAVRKLAGKPSGAISLNDLHGKSSVRWQSMVIHDHGGQIGGGGWNKTFIGTVNSNNDLGYWVGTIEFSKTNEANVSMESKDNRRPQTILLHDGGSETSVTLYARNASNTINNVGGNSNRVYDWVKARNGKTVKFRMWRS